MDYKNNYIILPKNDPIFKIPNDELFFTIERKMDIDEQAVLCEIKPKPPYYIVHNPYGKTNNIYLKDSELNYIVGAIQIDLMQNHSVRLQQIDFRYWDLPKIFQYEGYYTWELFDSSITDLGEPDLVIADFEVLAKNILSKFGFNFKPVKRVPFNYFKFTKTRLFKNRFAKVEYYSIKREHFFDFDKFRYYQLRYFTDHPNKLFRVILGYIKQRTSSSIKIYKVDKVFKGSDIAFYLKFYKTI